MSLHDEIAHYDGIPTPHITHVASPTRVQIFCPDALPAIGLAISFDAQGSPVTARISAHTGQGLATADLLSPVVVTVGSPILIHHEAAAIPNATDLRHAHFVLASDQEDALPFAPPAPAFDTLQASLGPLLTGHPLLDLLCPLTSGGTTLILDASSLRDPLLTGLTRPLKLPLITLSATPPLLPDALAHIRLPAHPSATAYRAALVNLGHLAQAPEALALLDLSSLRARGPMEAGENLSTRRLVAEINHLLPSTTSRRMTTLIYMALGPDLATWGMTEMVETLGLGDVHTQIFVDPKGHLDPLRSRSVTQPEDPAQLARARQVQAELARAQALGEKAAIFGLDELEEDEQALLTRCAALALSLLPPAQE